MDPKLFRDAYSRLRSLDERETHRVRPRVGLSRLSTEQLEERVKHLANYTLELKEIMDELFQAIASKPD